jgi:hypothetical protein
MMLADYEQVIENTVSLRMVSGNEQGAKEGCHQEGVC